MFSEFAAGSCSMGSIRGMAADLVGWFTAKNACCTDNRHSTTQTLLSASAACAHNNTDATASPQVAMISSTRRSIASANAPPHSPNTTNGTSPNTPASPT